MSDSRVATGNGEQTPLGKSADLPHTPRHHGRISITVTLATAIGILVLISVGSVLALGIWLAQKNTFSLLSDYAQAGVVADADRIESYLQPAEHQAAYIAREIERGLVDPDDPAKLGPLLFGSLAGVPQAAAVMFIGTDLKSFELGRDNAATGGGFERVDYADNTVVRASMAALGRESAWGPPVWSDEVRGSFVNHAHPIWRDGKLLGAIVSVVSIGELSSYLSDAAGQLPGTRFILYGRDRVLAHPSLAGGYAEGSTTAPLPALEGFKDRELAAIWNQDERYDLIVELAEGSAGHVVRLDDRDQVFVYRQIEKFGPQPLIVGSHFPADALSDEVERMLYALYAGIAALILSLLAAVLVGRRIARPIVNFSAAASRVRDLEISKVAELPGSVFRELNDQATAFNAMLRALRRFELYVPRSLVARLVRQGVDSAAQSELRELTIMFTDITDFSTMSENMSAPEVAALVNEHFSMVTTCIEQEGGTVDKFIGDCVMAFWGAPDRQPDTAERACRAALRIAAAIKADNHERATHGKGPVRIRIGLHTGQATVGNIGSPGRINYTIIGDAVNIAQRLEQLCKQLFDRGREVSILLSGDTASRLDAATKIEAAGTFTLKGRAQQTEVYRLID